MMTDDEFLRVYVLLKRKYGIDLERKKEIVEGRLVNYLRMNGFNSFSEYFNAVASDPTGRKEQEMVNMLTTNHTFFMREFEHFEFMRKEVLPWLRMKEEATKDLNVWCGAASTGQEPYMLEMLMMEFFGLEHHKWNTQLLATDLSTDALSQAVKGVYSKGQLENVPDAWMRRFFRPTKEDGYYEVTKEVKDQIVFRQFNLMDQFPFRRKFHVIFLRNVMIYFDAPTKKQLINKIADSLMPGGYLFIGRTETIDRSGTSLKMIEPSVFRKEL